MTLSWKGTSTLLLPFRKGRYLGMWFVHFPRGSTVGCIEWEHWSLKWECWRWSTAADCTAAALSHGSYSYLHFGCWKRATIMEYSRATVNLSWIDRSAVTKSWGPLPYGTSFKHLFLYKTFLGHQQCSQLCITCEK